LYKNNKLLLKDENFQNLKHQSIMSIGQRVPSEILAISIYKYEIFKL